jgi:hypothetical protein
VLAHDLARIFFGQADAFERRRLMARTWLRLARRCADEAERYATGAARAYAQAIQAAAEYRDATAVPDLDTERWRGIERGIFQRLERERETST